MEIRIISDERLREIIKDIERGPDADVDGDLLQALWELQRRREAALSNTRKRHPRGF